MATAIKEAPEQEESQDVFVMPAPSVNQWVDWYPHGQKNVRPQPAIVLEVGQKTCRLMSMDMGSVGIDLGPVPHVDDPRLKTNDHIRKNYGGWDFRAEDKRLNGRMKALEAKLAEQGARLERLLADLGADKQPAKK